MASKGLLAVLLAAGAFLAGAAISFRAIQTDMISSDSGPGSCDPGFRLPVSLEATMYGIDAAVIGIVAAACSIPAKNLLVAMPFTRRRLVRDLATFALYIGVLVPFPAPPTCPAASARRRRQWPRLLRRLLPHVARRVAPRQRRRRSVAILAVGCISVYVNLNYLDADDDDVARED